VTDADIQKIVSSIINNNAFQFFITRLAMLGTGRGGSLSTVSSDGSQMIIVAGDDYNLVMSNELKWVDDGSWPTLDTNADSVLVLFNALNQDVLKVYGRVQQVQTSSGSKQGLIFRPSSTETMKLYAVDSTDCTFSIYANENSPSAFITGKVIVIRGTRR